MAVYRDKAAWHEESLQKQHDRNLAAMQTNRDKALQQRDQVQALYNAAVVQRDQAMVQRDEAVVQRDQAVLRRDEAVLQHDQALLRRNEVVDVVLRGEAIVQRSRAERASKAVLVQLEAVKESEQHLVVRTRGGCLGGLCLVAG